MCVSGTYIQQCKFYAALYHSSSADITRFQAVSLTLASIGFQGILDFTSVFLILFELLYTHVLHSMILLSTFVYTLNFINELVGMVSMYTCSWILVFYLLAILF